MSWIKIISAILISLFISLMLMEFILRIFQIGYGNLPLERSSLYHHKSPSNYNYLMHDPLGEYGGHHVYFDKDGFSVKDYKSNTSDFIDKANSIIFLGDSFTQGVQVSYENTFSDLVGKNLGVNSINLGVTSYSPIIYLLQVKNIVRKFKAETVILQIYSNDFTSDFRYAEKSIQENDEIIAIDGGKNNFLISTARKSYLLRFLRKNQLLISEMLSSKDKYKNQMDKAFAYEQKVSDDQIANTSNIISEINDILKNQDKTLLVFLIPSKYLSKRGECCVADKLYVKFYNELSKLDIETIDVSINFENSLIQEDLFFDKDIHLTKSGHKLLAKSITDYLINREN